MTPAEQKKAAKEFVEYWQAAEGSEDQESQKFWIDLYQNVLGVANAVRVLNFEKHVIKGKENRKVDVFHEDAGVLIEMKSRGVDLDKLEQRGKDKYGNTRMVTPYEQARWYADNMVPRSIAPRWLMTCNFDEFRIYDLNNPNAENDFDTIMLDELPEQIHRMTFLVKKENSRAEREKALSIEAGVIVGKLYDAFAQQYRNIDTDKNEQQSLNILITRIVFMLFAEDAGLLQEIDAFYKYLKEFNVDMMADALRLLFETLRTPEEERNPYRSPAVLAFPYINGGLFEDDILIPQFTPDLRYILLQNASAGFNWADISPTIFGAVFESTLNPETRRAGGMHYTSVENIHKVTGPLFYDALFEELTEIENEKVTQKREFKLKAFHKKLASIKVFDPACGSGNFLTETYLSLRKLENRVIEDINGIQMVMLDADDLIQVKVDQFYGIEINGFAVEVAKTALWIAELQMIAQTREVAETWIEPLPLKTNRNIHCGNALRMDWNDVLPAEECDYIIGNPPFRGARWQSKEQKADLSEIFADTKNVGDIDYVACWHKKAVDYSKESNIRCAFVSTNSICQGEQVANIWKPMFERYGVHFDFCWRTFVWDSEATDKAHVHVVIVGFGGKGAVSLGKKTIFEEKTGIPREASHINAYLLDAPDAFVYNRSKPLCDVPIMGMGSQPLDDGNFLFTEEEKNKFLAMEPKAERFFHPFTGAKEFLNGYTRWCLWLGDVTSEELDSLPACGKRVDAVRQYRLASKRSQTYKAAEYPTHFGTEIISKTNSIVLPQTSSERRMYIPIGFMGPETFCSDKVRLIPDATIYHFGILTSQFHNAWMRVVAGRLEMRYIYSNKLVYNNFIWPEPTDGQRQAIEACAQAVLDARDNHPDDSLATLYDPDKMPQDLLDAHKALDAAVEAAYGVDFNGDEEKIVAHLFKLYAEATASESKK